MLQCCGVFDDLRISLKSSERRRKESKVVAGAVSARCWQCGGDSGVDGSKSAASTAKQAVWIHSISHVNWHTPDRHAGGSGSPLLEDVVVWE